MRPNPEQIARREALARVREIYAELERRPVERTCALRAECCCFALTGRTPYVTRGEALVAAAGVRATGRKTLPKSVDGACPLLDPRTRRCMIYKERPFGCRTHFCEAAGGTLARAEVAEWIRKLEAIDARLGGTGARLFPKALAEEITRAS